MTDWSPIGSYRDLSTLRRSTDSRVAGVCGGLGARFGIDPNIVRVAFVVLALAGGAGFLAYLGAWILLPSAGQDGDGSRSTRSMVAGGALLTIAGLMALVTVGGVEPVGTAIFGLLFAGIVILNRRPAGIDGPTEIYGPDRPPAPAGSAPGFSPLDFAPADTVPNASDPDLPERPGPDGYLADEPLLNPIPPDPVEANSRPGLTLNDPAPRSHWAVPKVAEETSLTPPGTGPGDGPPLAAIAMAATLAILGVALVLNTVAGVYVGAAAVVGAATAVVGLMMAITAFRGRTVTMVPLAVILLILLPVAPIADQIIRDGTGSTYVTVAGADDLASSYRLGVGELILDLSRVEIDEDTGVDVEIGTGSLEIRLPPGTTVLVEATTRVGYLHVLGEERAGLGNRLRVRSSGGEDEDAVLVLDVSAEIGSVDVYQDSAEIVEDVPLPSVGPSAVIPVPEPSQGVDG